MLVLLQHQRQYVFGSGFGRDWHLRIGNESLEAELSAADKTISRASSSQHALHIHVCSCGAIVPIMQNHDLTKDSADALFAAIATHQCKADFLPALEAHNEPPWPCWLARADHYVRHVLHNMAAL